MKLQYLGDSKDSFKWDYLNYLVEHLRYEHLKIAWMMTPDDHGTDGGTPPNLFPAEPRILTLCNRLRTTRNTLLLSQLPKITKSNYSVSFHQPDQYFNARNRDSYFKNIEWQQKQVLFLDPDNGFEPERSFSEKHVRYEEIENILKKNKTAPDSVITVFQHPRRKKFPDDFARIRKRLISGHSTAIYWHSLMFVSISLCSETIDKISAVNREYIEKIARVKAIT